MMKTVTLSGKSMKGKNRVREHGSVWVIHAEVERVLFNSEPGPWLFVSPVGKAFQDKSSRWIHADNDQDFNVNPAQNS
jgi:hypothetical protein